jgi:hypothetical protein
MKRYFVEDEYSRMLEGYHVSSFFAWEAACGKRMIDDPNEAG